MEILFLIMGELFLSYSPTGSELPIRHLLIWETFWKIVVIKTDGCYFKLYSKERSWDKQVSAVFGRLTGGEF